MKQLQLLLVTSLFTFTMHALLSQSNSCAVSPTILMTNSVCIPQPFVNTQNGSDGSPSSCGIGTRRRDVWYVVYGTGNPITINVGATNTDMTLSVHSACLGPEIGCSWIPSGGGGSVGPFASAFGTPYYVRIQRYNGGWFNDQFGTICATSVTPAAPVNDDPCTATVIPVGASCTMTTYNNNYATYTTTPGDPGCGGFQGNDVWFQATVPPSGTLIVDGGMAGAIVDGAMAIYSGTCGALVLEQCDDDSGAGSMPSITLTSVAAGNTVWIRFWAYGADRMGDFDLCAYEGAAVGPCGNPLNNDWCDAPATLTQGPGSWSSTTYNIYSPDTPANLLVPFCGTVENNSWYQFTALNTSEVFDFTYVGNCLNGDGIQAQVYDVTNDFNGCCTNFASVSNCESPGSVTPFIITAVGLTIGNTYVLMVDGYAGDWCDFTVSNWTATGILPVELIDLTGIALPRQNVVSWKTVSEENNDYFEILRTYDGKNWESIGTVEGAGTSSETIAYQFSDEETRNGVAYYRLRQFDYNGENELSKIISINRSGVKENGLITVYPNPSTGDLTIEINGKSTDGTVIITDLNGNILLYENVRVDGFSKMKFDITSFSQGVYFVKYIDSETSSTKKIVKK